MNNTEPLNLTGLIKETKERELYYLRSTIKCVNCRVIFPIEYDNCPQCELEEMYRLFDIKCKKISGEKPN